MKTSNDKDLDAWVNGLSKDKINSVLAYLILKETEQLKKEMIENEGKVVTPIELEENSIVPDLEMYREIPQIETYNITTDISKMKRVREVNIKRDDTQYELNIGSKNMAGPRKGLYDDRPKEEPMNALEYLASKKDEEIDSLRTFMFTVKILEDAKVTGKKLKKLPVPLLDFISKYEEVYGALSKKKEEE